LSNFDKQSAKAFLEHHGVLGMRWGHHKLSTTTTYRSHPDSTLSRTAEKKLQTKGIHTLSNQELHALINRRNLEKRVMDTSTHPILRGSKITRKILTSHEGRLALRVAKSQLARETAATVTAVIALALARRNF
jgi:hypothetical protein